MKRFYILSIILLVILSLGFVTTDTEEATNAPKEWAIALHGGAGNYPVDASEERTKQYEEALAEALSIGSKILEEGGSALDAVEQTINYLENNELFNAGRGAVFTSEGKNELDAAIMDGSQMNAGAITGVTTVKNPISLARKVMEESTHVFFAAEGAEEFADQTTVERVDPEYFKVERRYEAWKRRNAGEGMLLEGSEDNSWKFGTVGCVALDKDGNLVAGTSTGGMTNKKFGRVGDVPIIGSGTYADDLVAVSATGWGEKIMLNVSAHTLASYMRFKEATLDESMDYLVNDVLNPKEAGFIAVDKDGNISMETNTGSMFRASADSDGNEVVAIYADE
ncbi:MAG: isoaspartyl peptidase/L-asparaginase [Balneolaceae bacterium]|nr:isoaspartyl peptidase/L-asparaginase [Balneolaceae bacterium]MBO6545403.1 isoaspartyl peptidase/L-asparaginase [Balneolaceae bacterium]MBO6646799.1 isoaspartyl peptidase/L-asparaginase [Balneolaceae bacterium]